ncbi:MAG TPA: DsbC family protein [Halothiobacillus sp.]|nr:DsbC family protein [Halothiobacillus sp.]
MKFSRSLVRAAITASVVGLSVQMAVQAVWADSSADEQVIRKNLTQYMPNLPIDSVTPTPVKGIYQVLSKGQIAYVTADGRYLFAGNLLDLKAQVNLTGRVRSLQNLELLKTVPADHKMVYPAEGVKKSTIWVLTDPTCPFCEKLHGEIPALQKAGIEVQTILTPRDGKGSAGYVESSQIMCGHQQKADLSSAMAHRPLGGPACKNAVIDANMQLADELGMSGTPYIIMPDGSSVPGYRPASALIPEIIQASTGSAGQ